MDLPSPITIDDKSNNAHTGCDQSHLNEENKWWTRESDRSTLEWNGYGETTEHKKAELRPRIDKKFSKGFKGPFLKFVNLEEISPDDCYTDTIQTQRIGSIPVDNPFP